MVYCLDGSDNSGSGYVIRPNQAISWRTLICLYLIIFAVSMAIGLSFFMTGLTYVLPFSGLEMLALGAALYVTAHRGGVQEVIIIGTETITVESGRQVPESHEEFSRAWANVVLERSWNSWYPSRLLIRSHGRQLEIGRFLNEQERQGLALELTGALKRKLAA